MGDRGGHIRLFFFLTHTEKLIVRDITFCPYCDLYHRSERFYRIFPGRRLPGQHDRACPLVDRIGHIRRLGTGRPRVLHHGVQHLRGSDHLLSRIINFCDDLLLDDRHVLQRDLHAHIAAGDHDPVRCLDNAVNIVDSLLVLYLRDDIDLLPAILAQELPDLFHIIRCPRKRSRDKVKALLDAEQDILPVLFTDKRHADIISRKVDPFSVRNRTAVLYDTVHILPFDAHDLKADQAVIYKDTVARFYVLIEVFISDRHSFLSPLDIVRSEGKYLPFLQLDLPFCKCFDTDLRPFCIQEGCHIFSLTFSDLL